jgi:hypothetical protein
VRPDPIHLLSDPAVPMITKGFWGAVVLGNRWEELRGEERFLDANSTAAGASGESERQLSSSTSDGTYSEFLSWEIYECVDDETCLGTSALKPLILSEMNLIVIVN